MERSVRRALRAVLALVFSAASAAPAGDFRPAEPVVGLPAAARDLFLSVDRSGSAAIAFSAEGEIRFLPLYGIPPSAQPVRPGARPVLAALSPLQSAIAYAAPVAQGREAIELALGGSGMFGDPERLTDAAPQGERPALAVDGEGGLWALWSQIAPDESILRLLRPDGLRGGIGRGSRPAIAADPNERVLAAYLRRGDLYVRRVEMEEPGDEIEIAKGVASYALAPAADRGWLIVMERAGRIEFASILDTEVGAQAGAAVVLGEGTSPAVAARSVGRAAAAWIQGDRIRLARIEDGLPGATVTVASGLTGPRDLAVGVDPDGAILAIFRGEDGPLWTSDALVPSPAFRAEPREGDAPLDVRFIDTSDGIVRGRRWVFGDGGSSTTATPRYAFDSPGVWSVRLVVAGPGGRAEKIEEEAIRVAEPENVLFFRPESAPAGARGRSLPIHAKHRDPLQAVSIAFAHPIGDLTIEDLRVDGTAFEALAPEFVTLRRGEGGGEALLAGTVVVDWRPPYDGRTLPPGAEQIVARLIYSIHREGSPGTEIVLDLRDGVGDPPLGNVFTRQGAQTISPYLVDGVIRITEASGSAFIRGDANGDDRVDIADAIFLLSYLFQDGAEPTCMDAADANDAGGVNIADAIWILNFYFADGPSIPPPYPEPGDDPTPDNLPVC